MQRRAAGASRSQRSVWNGTGGFEMATVQNIASFFQALGHGNFSLGVVGVIS